MEQKPLTYVPSFTHEEAVAIFRRLVADKREAEREIEENFHTNPIIQASVARLRAKQEQPQDTKANV